MGQINYLHGAALLCPRRSVVGHFVNLQEICLLEHLGGPLLAAAGDVEHVGHGGKLLLVGGDAQLGEAGGHLDGAVEVLHGLDALQGHILGGSGVLHAHHVDGELDKPVQAVPVDIPGPAAPDGGQAGAMGHVKHAALQEI